MGKIYISDKSWVVNFPEIRPEVRTARIFRGCSVGTVTTALQQGRRLRVRNLVGHHVVYFFVQFMQLVVLAGGRVGSRL